LAEIDADAARGLIPPDEAVAARTEIARRMLKAADEDAAATPTMASAIPASRILTICAAAIPLLGLALYLQLGAPELPARPLSARL
ncbi:c-type cytochrome biogenesis protein CcmI, partial [Acinetobacter baumannii]